MGMCVIRVLLLLLLKGSLLLLLLLLCAQTLVYPEMHRFILHPCVSGGTQRAGCGAFFASTAVLRFESFFTQKKVVVSFTFEVGRPPFSLSPSPSTLQCRWADMCVLI
jgi:hypothetical protein